MRSKIITDKPVTKADLQEELKKYPTKHDLCQELDDKLQNYPTKSEMFSRFDQIMGTLEQIREDIVFHTHDINNLKEIDADQEKRLKKLEIRNKN